MASDFLEERTFGFSGLIYQKLEGRGAAKGGVLEVEGRRFRL